MTSYVRYRAGVEVVPEEIDTVSKKEGHSMRGSHAKATGYLTGELTVKSGLPEELAQGLFAQAGTYEVLVRLAQGPGELLDDSVSIHRGMSVRILGVPGESIPESRQSGIQDWLFATGSAFANSTAKTFLANFKGIAASASLPQAVKGAVSAIARAAESGLEALGMTSATLDFLGHPSRHPLADNYFSQAPIRFGDYIAKMAFVPSNATLAAIGEDAIDASGRPNAFRDAVVSHFASNEAAFDIRVQLCTDLDAMPVENANAQWSQDDSPYRTVATIRLPRQVAYNEARRLYFDESIGFQPAYALAAHRPLGGIMRARIAAYGPLQDYRRCINGAMATAPKSLSDVPA